MKEVELLEERWLQAEREKELEKEKFQAKLTREFKITRQLLEEIQTSENPDPDTMKAIARKVLRILERNDI